MRIATSEGLLTWTYVLRDSRSGPALATVDLKSLKSSGTVTVEDVVYGFEQTDFWGKKVVFTFEGVELAKAVRTSSWSAKTTVAFAPGGFSGPDLRLIPLGAFQVGFHVEEDGGERIGRIERKGFLKTSFQLRLPESVPLAVQGFLTAIALIDLRRRQSS
ncbi:MAG: hypothetical protein Rubg2KO_36330 [Rubricoccaceae bacterium]